MAKIGRIAGVILVEILMTAIFLGIVIAVAAS